jgi:serine/threonine protein kinase
MLVKKFGPKLNDFLISISDFGLSKKQEDASKKTQLSQNVGTLNYQAPELVMKLFSAYSLNKCDAWSVGIILH